MDPMLFSHREWLTGVLVASVILSLKLPDLGVPIGLLANLLWLWED